MITGDTAATTTTGRSSQFGTTSPRMLKKQPILFLYELVAAEATTFGLGLHECFYIFIAFLAVGVVAYAYAFEHWTTSLTRSTLLTLACCRASVTATSPCRRHWPGRYSWHCSPYRELSFWIWNWVCGGEQSRGRSSGKLTKVGAG